MTTTNKENDENHAGEAVEVPRLVSPLKLQKLTIELQGWGPNKGRYEAIVKYQGKKGEITLNLSPDLSDDLMRFCGGSIKRFSESAAFELQESIKASVKESEEASSLG